MKTLILTSYQTHPLKKMTKEIKQKKSLHLNMLQFKYSQWQTDLVFLIDDSALWSIKS